MNWSSPRLNISKTYFIDRPFEETSEQLVEIVSEKFSSPKYSIFGNLESVDPLEFQFMAKWVTIGRPTYAEITSTKIHVKLTWMDNKSRMDVKTKTNPSIIFLYFLVMLGFLVNLIRYKADDYFKLPAIYLLLVIGVFLFDRFVKNILIASFERDMNLIGKKK